MKKLILPFVLSIFAISFLNAQWEPDVRLTYNTAYSITTYPGRNIATGGDFVHVVWCDDRDGNYEIYYKRSTDNGANWGSDTRLTNAVSHSQLPYIAVAGQFVHIVWIDNREGLGQVYYKRSTNNGLTWDADTKLTFSSGYRGYPSIAVTGQIVHVVWHDNRVGGIYYEIYHKLSTDGGATWGADTRLTNKLFNSFNPSIAVFGTNVHIAWNDVRNGRDEIYCKQSTDGGATWGADTRLTNDTLYSWYPSIALSGTNVYIAWVETGFGNTQVCYKFSTDNGITWGDDKKFTNTPCVQNFPSISASDNNVYVVWSNQGGDYGIYYNISTNGGTNWGTNINITYADSRFPSVAVYGKFVHVLWSDTRDGNFEIYYKRNIIPPPCIININAGDDKEIIIGFGPQNVELSAIASGGTEPYTYLWTPGGATTQSITVSPTTTTTYTVEVRDHYQCTVSDEVTVNVLNIICGNNGERILICHNGITVCINPNAVPAHLAHGDYLGPCTEEPDNTNPIPEKFMLYENYPNPFNPTTTIKFSLPKSSVTKLIVYDVTGKEVQTLVNEQLNAGTYSVNFDGSKLASGMYFYKLVTIGFTNIKKMILLK